jgi:hypothetical protein
MLIPWYVPRDFPEMDIPGIKIFSAEGTYIGIDYVLFFLLLYSFEKSIIKDSFFFLFIVKIISGIEEGT